MSAEPQDLHSKPPFLCRIGLHDFEYVKEVQQYYQRGPFDPQKDRFRTMEEHICVLCGKKKLKTPCGSWDFD